MKVLYTLLTVFCVVNAVNLKELFEDEWISYKLQHRKYYNDAIEESFRMKIFLENRNKIAKHNQKYEQGYHLFKMGLNKYSDMLPYEFVSIMNGFNKSNSLVSTNGNTETGATFLSPANVKVPKFVDWRMKGAVTPIKDQGHCGSCWSFSATGALEGQHFRKTGILVSLSEQNLIDCSSSYGNNGCNGGMMDNAFRYIKENGGIDTEKSYLYEGVDDTCRFQNSSIGAVDKGSMDISEGDEMKLMQAVAVHGPVSVAIDASQQSFQFYSEGVYFDEHCSSEQLDHGVLVVGYGTDQNGTDYWLVKNSWGTTWGDNGYIKMARNKNNHCGIATIASFPLV